MSSVAHAQPSLSLLQSPGPCVTIAIQGAGGRTQWKEDVRSAQAKLREQGLNSLEWLSEHDPEVDAALTKLHPDQTLVVLRSAQVRQQHVVSGLAPSVTVGPRFDVRSVLAIEAADQAFYILALSQNRTRLLHCSSHESGEISFPPGTATGLEDWMQTRQPDHVLDNRSSAGPSVGGAAVQFGTSSDRDTKDEYLLHFFQQIDKAVHVTIKDSGLPLVPVAVEREIATYFRVNTYPHIVEPGVHGAPDGLEGGAMHKRALELLAERAQKGKDDVPGDFDKKVGAGLASTHIQEIVTAAYDGRVSHLYLQHTGRYSGVFDVARGRVKHTEDPLDSPVDLIEESAYQTLLHGGQAKLLPSSAMPNGVPVFALFRYAITPRTSESLEA